MGRACSIPPALDAWDTTYLDDDFVEEINTFKWTKIAGDSGTILVADAAKGVAVFLPSDGSVGDNDECYLHSTNELFLFEAGKPMYARGLIQFSEGNTDDLNVLFGFQSAPAADSLQDNGGGPRATGCCALIYKVDGGTVWRCQSRNDSEVTDSISTMTAGGSAYSLLEIVVNDYTQTRVQITYKVDGQFLKDSSGKVIVHQLLVAGATEMALILGAKNGDSGTVETLRADRLYAHHLRA